jgi:hypothetical protein
MNTARTFSILMLACILFATILAAPDARGARSSAPDRRSSRAAAQRDPGQADDAATRVDVSGEWTVTGTRREDPDPHELSMVLKQDRDTFSGSLTTNNGRFDIKDGKVKATRITFSIYLPQASMTASCSGTVDGESLKATCEMPNSTIDLAGHRHKKAE